jgi:hypothetical protein
MTRQEESPINIKRTTTYGHTDKVILWAELTDGSAAISKHLMMTISVEICSATVV